MNIFSAAFPKIRSILLFWLVFGNFLHAQTLMLGGIQVNEPDYGKWTQALQNAGMNTVSVTVYAKQGDWDSDNLWYEEAEPAVLSEIRAAKQAGSGF